MTSFQMIEQSDTTDANGEITVTFPGAIDKVAATINSPRTAVGAVNAFVSAAKTATVKLHKADGTALANHVCVVTVLAGNG